MSARVARQVVGGNAAHGFFAYADGTVAVEEAGVVSLAHAAVGGCPEALARLCELVTGENARWTGPGTFFAFRRPTYAAACEADSLTAGPRGILTEPIEAALRATLVVRAAGTP